MSVPAPLRNPPPRIEPTARYYRPELDALRFIAFFGVYLHHVLPRKGGLIDPAWGTAPRVAIASIANAGGFGLCLFFFLSSYLITELLRRERTLTGRVSLPAFWIRRILRIWPLYTVGLAIGVCVSHWQHDPADDGRMLSYAVMLGNWFCIRNGWSPNPMTPLWSISIEEQFYLLWPMLLLLPWALAKRLPLLFMVISAAALTYLGCRHAALETEVWPNSFVQLGFLGGGAALALGRISERLRPTRVMRWLLGGLALALWFLAAGTLQVKAIAPAAGPVSLVAGYALILAGCAALFLSLLGTAGVPRWAAWLGRISYGLYVFHLCGLQLSDAAWPSLEASRNTLDGVLRAMAGLILTIIFATVSYYVLERPFLRIKDRFARIMTRPA